MFTTDPYLTMGQQYNVGERPAVIHDEMRLTLTCLSEDTFALPVWECSVRGCSVTDPAGVEGAAMLLKRASMTAKEAPTSSPWGFRQKRIEPLLLRNLLFVVDVTGISTN